MTKKIEDYYLDENLELFRSEIKKEKEKEFRTKKKEFIFKKNYGLKIELFNKSNQFTNNKSKPGASGLIKNKSKDYSLNEYISNIKNNYKENPLEYESINITNNKEHYKYSFCGTLFVTGSSSPSSSLVGVARRTTPSLIVSSISRVSGKMPFSLPNTGYPNSSNSVI